MSLKKLLLLYLIAMFPNIVNANEYHKIEGTCIESENCIKEEIKKYNTYSIKYIDMGYMEENDDYIKDDNDFIIEEGNEFITLHNTSKKVSELYFSLNTDIKIYEIEIYSKEKLIFYTPRLNFYVQFSNNLYDKNLDTYYIHGNKHILLQLDLDNEYDIEDLVIKLYTKTEENSTIRINSTSNNIYLDNSIDRWHIINFKNDEIDIVEQVIDNKIKYRYYKEEKIINNIYVEDGDNLIKDDYIIDYIYYAKDDECDEDDDIEDAYINNEEENDSNEYISNDIDISNKEIKEIKKENTSINTITYKADSKNSDTKVINNKNIDIIKNEEKTYNVKNDNRVIDKLDYENKKIESLEKESVVENNIIKHAEKTTMKNDLIEYKIITKEKHNNSKMFKIIISFLLIVIDLIIIVIKRNRKNVESI